MHCKATLGEHRPRKLAFAASALATTLAASPTLAFEVDTGNPDFGLRWDTTVKYSAANRLHAADPALASDVNLGDGDTNFRNKGLVSSRFDLLSELEGNYRGTGFRLSGAAWNDSRYLRANANNTAGAFGPGTHAVNSTEISAANQFSPYTRKTHGRDAELLDAFVSTRFDLDGHAATVRLGQHTVVWGESVFFGDNGIAGAMSPVDVAKALSVPNLRFQEILRPVPQVSGQYQINSDLTAYAYYQAKWVENRSQGAGSYFSPIDFQTGGNLLFGQSGLFMRAPTRDGKNSGQGGVSLRYRGEDTDYGLYLLRFNSKSSTIVTNPVTNTFYENYHNGITSFGASANRSVGKFNLAVEASYRKNQDLLSLNAYDVGGGARYATGNTFHLNLSAFGVGLGKTALWNDATLIGELAYNHVVRVTSNADTLSGCQPSYFPGSVCQPNGTRGSTRMQVMFEPVWFQALPGVDLRLPMGFSYQFKGSRNMIGPAPMPDGGGSINLGLSGSYLDVWRFGLSWTHYLGKAEPLFGLVSGSSTPSFNYGQVFRDRDYLSLYLTRTF